MNTSGVEFASPFAKFAELRLRNAPDSKALELGGEASASIEIFLRGASLPKDDLDACLKDVVRFRDAPTPADARLLVASIQRQLKKKKLSEFDGASAAQLRKGLVALVDFAKLSQSKNLVDDLLELKSIVVK